MKRRFGSSSPMECRPFDELAVARDALERRASHARHDRHVDDDVGAVGDLHAAARIGRVDRAHAVRHDVQRAALHAALEQLAHLRVRFVRGHPVVVRAGVVAILRADEGQVLDARHVRRVRVGDVAAGKGSLVELLELAGLLERLLQARQLGRRPVAPLDLVRGGELADGLDPIGDRGRNFWKRERATGALWPSLYLQMSVCPDETKEYSGAKIVAAIRKSTAETR